ncbi:MAG: hypothetical protein AAB863_01745 [Patescibacteria group bacterium]
MNKKLLVLVFAIIIVFAGAWAYTKAAGEQVSMCVKHNGLSYIIGENFKLADCRENDSLISWNTTGPQGPKGDKGDKGDMGERGPAGLQLHLYDGNNQDLGILVGRSSTYLPTLAVVADFDLGYGTFRPTVADLFYEQADCQSTPFVSPSMGLSEVSSIDLENLYRVPADPRQHPPTYRIIRSALPASRNYLSKSNFQGPTSPSPCVSPGLRGPTPLIAVEEVTLPFTEPLTSPLEIR